MKTVLPLIGEYLGTFLLTLTMLSSTNPLFIGATFGLIVFLIQPISGAQINPAISVAQYLNGKLGVKETVVYVAIQILAAVSSYYTYSVLA